MAGAALAARLVEVIADLGPPAAARYRYGSGCIVRGGTVLTAAHVVAGALSVVVRDPAKREYTATVDPRFVGDADGPGPDLALLEVADPAFGGDLPPIGLAAVDRDKGEPVERCHAVGYPWFAETRSRVAVRDTVDAIGVVPVLSNLAAGLLSVQVTVAPRALPPQETALGKSEWSGMSGAPVVAAGCLLGVVTEHAPRQGPSAITAVPLTALQADPAHEQWGPGVSDPAAWWARLGVSGSQALQRLPVPPLRAEPAYWATVREVRGQATLVGWDGELAELAAFSIGSEGYLQLTGEAWVGKTTLVAEFVLSGLPPGVDAVAYHLVRAEAEATAEKFLSAVVPQLAYLLGLPATPTDTHTFRHYWEQAVERAEREKRHLLLVVDGLDEDLQPAGPRSSVARLLPRRVGGRAHVLVTTRSGVPLPAVSDHPLGAARQLPLIGHPDAELARVRAQQELDDLLRDADELEAKVVGTLAAAAGPLTIEDLLALLPGTRSLALTRTLTERAARTMSMPGKPGRASYRFAHQSLLMQARSTMELEVPQLREEIHKWADGWRSRHWRDDDGTPVPAYLLESYPDTLVPGSGQDGDLGRLAALTSDVGWVAAAVRASGVDRVLGTLRTATSVLPDGRLPESDNGEMTTARLAGALHAQSYALRSPWTTADKGFVLRQLCMHGRAAGDGGLAAECTDRLLELPPPQLVPTWTTMSRARLLTRQFGQIVSVSVSADGSRTAVGLGHEVQVFDGDGILLCSLAPAGLHVYAAAISADGRRVAAVGSGKQLGVFDAWTGTLTGGPLSVGSWSLGLNEDGTVVVFDREGQAGIWHTAEAQSRTVPALQGYPAAVGINGDGRRVVTCPKDGQPVVWDEATDTLYAPTEKHPSSAVAISADGAVAVSGDANGTLRAWDVTSGQSIGTVQPHPDRITAVAVTRSGSLAVAGDETGRLLRWNLTRGVVLSAVAHLGAVSAIAVTADGGRMLSGGADGTVWDRDMLSAAGSSSTPAGSASAGPAHVLGLGESVVVSSGEKALLQIRNLVTGKPIRDLAGPAGGEPMGPVHAVTASPDGSVIVAVGQDPRVLVWGPSGPTPTVLRGHRTELHAVAVTGNGPSVFAGDAHGVTVGWDVATPTHALMPVTYEAHGTVTALAVSSDGCWLVCGTDLGEVWRWRVATGTGEMILPQPDDPAQLGPRVNAVAVSPDGSRITVVNVDGRLRSWVNGVAAPEVPGRGLNQVWTAAADGTAAMIDDHIWLQVKPTGGAPLHAVTIAPATAVALGPSGQGEPRSLAVAHPGGAVTMFQLTG